MQPARRVRQDRETAHLTDDGSSRLLTATGWTLWDNALLLIACSLVLLIVLVPFVIFASVVGWLLAWTPMILAAAPTWLATVALSDRLLDGDGVRILEFPLEIRTRWRVAVQLALIPAVLGSLALGLLEIGNGAADPGIARLLIPGIVGVMLSVVVLIGPAFVFAVRMNGGPRTAWLLAARLVVRRPVQQIGLVVCFGVLLWLAVIISPVLLLGLGPMAMLTAALARTSPLVKVDNLAEEHRP